MGHVSVDCSYFVMGVGDDGAAEGRSGRSGVGRIFVVLHRVSCRSGMRLVGPSIGRSIGQSIGRSIDRSFGRFRS